MVDKMECQVSSLKENTESERPSVTQKLANLVCPVCYEYMQPPIMTCEQKHSICVLCYELLSNCPQCHGELTDRRDSALEALTAVMKFPCKYCNKRFSMNELNTHSCFQSEEGDNTPIATCIVGQVYGDCIWSGHSADMAEHCANQHPHNFWTTPENIAIWKNSDLSSIGVQNIFIGDLGTAIFVIIQKFNSQTGTLCWNLSYECANNERCDYEIKFFHNNECVLNKKTQIENAFNIMTFFPSSNEITVDLDSVSKYLNEDNVIKYKVVIHKRDENANSHSVVVTNGISSQVESVEKPNCISKAWNSVTIFYNSVKKYFHL